MVQRFEMDPTMPLDEQIRETEFNILKGVVNIFYYGKGQIVSKEKQYFRADLVGKARSDEVMGDKETVEDAKT